LKNKFVAYSSYSITARKLYFRKRPSEGAAEVVIGDAKAW
jgi:hypothetical protein